MPQYPRRTVLRAGGALLGTAAIGSMSVSAANTDEDGRYFIDMDTTSMSELEGADLVYDFRDEIGWVVVRCPASELPESAVYTADAEIERDSPEYGNDSDLNASEDVDDELYELQWDKKEQRIGGVHDQATGDDARIGILDDGVLGAGDRSIAGSLDGHPDLPNVRGDLSRNFSRDDKGPGPLNDDHGTHVAGTAAAAADAVGVVGVAPDAEIVDLRVFSGRSARFSDIIAAIFYGSSPVSDGEGGGAGCDVLNLSLGTPPLLPVDKASSKIVSEDDPDGPGPIIPASAEGLALLIDILDAAADFAAGQGTLPVAAAGNDGVNLDRTYEKGFEGEIDGISFDGSPVVLPASVDGFMSISACGPIGYGWPGRFGSETVAPGISIESPILTELPSEEPAVYTNYGEDAVDVSASGGNADLDARDAGENWFYDLVFNTGIANLDPSAPEDAVLETYIPGYKFKAGTSFAAPTVSGLAALLFAAGSDPSPDRVRNAIENTANRRAVGRAGETTAPGAKTNVAADGTFDGDTPSNPGSNTEDLESSTYRGDGHIDVGAAVRAIRDG